MAIYFFQIGKILVLFECLDAKFRNKTPKFFEIARFCSKFQQVAKNIEGT
jgi:hypothetical protein